jgi:hypothetical protein
MIEAAITPAVHTRKLRIEKLLAFNRRMIAAVQLKNNRRRTGQRHGRPSRASEDVRAAWLSRQTTTRIFAS